jgi:ferric-dicitrate binding protein FerR (iron transport regulator)
MNMNSQDRQSNPIPRELETWLASQSNEGRAELEDTWRLTALANDPYDPDEDRVESLKSALFQEVYASLDQNARSGQRRLFWAAAAVLAIGLAITIVLQPIRYQAPTGKVLSITLPDRSSVQLNSGSSLERNRLFGWFGRSVSLSGEAFFDVSPNRGSFEVTTFNSRVEVVGTRFNVRAWETDLNPETIVFVESGRVRVVARANENDATTLEAGQSARIRHASHVVSELEGFQDEPSWRDGGMAFNDVPLRVILDEIERRHGVSIVVSPDSLERVPVSLRVGRAVAASAVLELVAGAHKLSIEERPGGYILRKDR